MIGVGIVQLAYYRLAVGKRDNSEHVFVVSTPGTVNVAKSNMRTTYSTGEFPQDSDRGSVRVVRYRFTPQLFLKGRGYFHTFLPFSLGTY